ncbi:MAG: DUF134 domain-containing protein [Bacillota bacterium]
MPRPNKKRYIYEMPKYYMFGPKGKRANSLKKITMLIDEFETVRLMDELDLTQAEAAERLGVARTTVQRIYNNARKKLADAIINGKVLVIEGGDYIVRGDWSNEKSSLTRKGRGRKRFNKPKGE